MERLAAWWSGLPSLPDLPVPPPADPDLIVVIGTIVLGFGLAGLTNAWVDRRRSKAGVFATVVGILLMLWVWEGQREFGLALIPEAFIELLARIIR